MQDDHRASRLVIRGIEPVAKIEALVAVRRITTLVVEVVHRYGEVICRVVDSSCAQSKGAEEKAFHGEEYVPVGCSQVKNTNITVS